jgi:hypothetical protein
LKLVVIACVIGISVTFQVLDRAFYEVLVVIEHPKPTIALGTQQPTNGARGMAVVYRKMPHPATRFSAAAYSAAVILSGEHFVVRING